MKDLINGLLSLHENHIAHMDMKLKNVLVDKSLNNLVISDFGISKSMIEHFS